MSRRAFLAAAAALAACVALYAFAAPGAFAHARYKESTPAKGEVLATSPSQVSVTFTQDVQKISGTYGIEVTQAVTGTDVTAGAATLNDADRSQMSVPLQPGLAPGRYIVHWKNVSDEDGDPAEGAFAFYVGVQPTAADLAADAELAGAEEEEATPTAAATVPPASASPIATAPADQADADDGGGNNAVTAIIIAAAVAAGAVIGFAGWRFFGARRT